MLTDEQIAKRMDVKKAARNTAAKIEGFIKSGHDFSGGFAVRLVAINESFVVMFGESV